MPKREPQSWEMVLKRNSVERLKHDLFPTELTGQWDRLVETSYEKLPEEDVVRLQWFGLYHDKPKVGSFMMRIKIPSGILSAEALATIGEIAEHHDLVLPCAPGGGRGRGYRDGRGEQAGGEGRSARRRRSSSIALSSPRKDSM